MSRGLLFSSGEVVLWKLECFLHFEIVYCEMVVLLSG